MRKYLQISKKLPFVVFYLSILFFIVCFNFKDSPPPSNWYQQFIPNMGSEQLADITFLDSLVGYAITQTHNILKTTNGGDNWNIIYNDTTGNIFTRLQFLNESTGFVGAYNTLKTTNGGNNWFQISTPVPVQDIYVLNEDTIWIVFPNSLVGGVFRTTNGGASWQQQFSGGTQNPNKIYMFNPRIGFMCNSSGTPPNIYKTTNGGANWLINLSNDYFFDMRFIDSLTGWKCNGIEDSSMQKTTDSGLNWTKQILPYGGSIITSVITNFCNVNHDTIWGVGGFITYGTGGFRGMLFRTTNGGQNWLFQIPDTTIHITSYAHIQFINRNIGWAYSLGQGGIHTTNGGDTTFLNGIQQISSIIPEDFKLYQNYPNPFNPVTNIKYQIIKNVKRETSDVRLIVVDITGKIVTTLVNQKQSAGTYQVDFSGANYSSGVYFYSLFIDDKLADTKKMVLLK